MVENFRQTQSIVDPDERSFSLLLRFLILLVDPPLSPPLQCRKMAEKVHTFEEVAKHNHKGASWLIISGKVYDVTPFLEDHPGGDDVLLNSTGKDATSDFEDVGHSDDAQEKMKEFYIGDIDEYTLPQKEKHSIHPTASSNHVSGNSGSSKVLLYILPLLVLGIAFLLRMYTKKE